MKYKFIKDYKAEETLRKSFSELAKTMFGINFEKWYAKGLWGNQYIPYSLVDGEKVIANISVSLMDFEVDGEIKKYIQLGTVMTDKAYRGQGCSRYLMEMILAEYVQKADGVYLFANNSVLEFYPKFGFEKSTEYEYSKVVDIAEIHKGNSKMIQVDMGQKENLEKLLEVVKRGKTQYNLQMKNNPGLIGFYAMDEMIYKIEGTETYVFAEINGDELMIQDIISDEEISLEQVIGAFEEEIRVVKLGFVPLNKEGYALAEHHEEGTTLFILGDDLKQIAEKKLMFPVLSHA